MRYESATQEIPNLKRKVEELEAQITESEFATPAGNELVAHGTEVVMILFRLDMSVRLIFLMTSRRSHGIIFFRFCEQCSLMKRQSTN